MSLRRLYALVAIALLPVAAAAAQIDASRLSDLPKADVVILGEVHDNAEHHAHQATAVAALRPAALVFEMLTPQQAGGATPTARITATALGRALGWDESGWPDFNMYFPIFIAAPDAAVFGGALPATEVRRAVNEGAAAVFGPESAQFGLDRPLDLADQAAREAEQMAVHCNALPVAMLPGMVEAQRLRDAALARAVMRAFAETGGPVAVITGTGHARRDWGVPAVLAQAAPRLSVLSVGQVEVEPGATLPTDPPFDLWLATPPALRGDPCEGFAVE